MTRPPDLPQASDPGKPSLGRGLREIVWLCVHQPSFLGGEQLLVGAKSPTFLERIFLGGSLNPDN
jgi:hypothetical protein